MITSRNLRVGVWTGAKWIGVREKFSDRYLFGEYGPGDGSFDTVDEVGEFLGRVPEEIPLKESTPTECEHCGTPATWTGPPSPAPWVCEGGCEKTSPISHTNQPLFDLLETLDDAQRERDRLAMLDRHRIEHAAAVEAGDDRRAEMFREAIEHLEGRKNS